MLVDTVEQDIALEAKNVCQSFGGKNVLFDINFQIKRGQFVGLVGPSGCGKSTLLKAILGTQLASDGKMIIHHASKPSHIVTAPGRDCGIVFQGYSLLPNMTALQNVALGLRLDESATWERLLRFYSVRRPGRNNVRLSWRDLKKIQLGEAETLLRKLGLGDALHKYPYELSGGMCQRVSIAQALIMKPKILLLDEPFSALDLAIRKEILEMLLALYQENLAAKKAGQKPPYTIIMVTHEYEDAILAGDRVIGLSKFWDSSKVSDPRAKGASTVIYDEMAPVFVDAKDENYRSFVAQTKEIYDVVFSPDLVLDPNEHVIFWKQYAQAMTEDRV
jgi:NitT/TauT family transport system ATP-binding protein